MALRTTDALVREIIEVDKKTTDLTPFITPANELVTELCTNSGYSAERLELIERWLSAHFYAILAPRAKEEKAGPVSQTLQSRVELGLNVTHYGQAAMRLDTKGNLASMDIAATKGKARNITVTHLGTTKAETK